MRNDIVSGLPGIALAILMAMAGPGCLDYDLDPQQDDVPDGDDPAPDPDGPGFTDGAPPEGLPQDDPEEPEEEDLPDCEDTVMADWSWWGSMPFADWDDPTDGDGRPFYDMDFQMVDFSTVSMPDQGHVPSGHDKVYRAEFILDSLPPALFLSMQSDDGMSFYLNGQLVGHWGGAWQEEGCVNDDAGCLESVVVAPVDVTSYLQVGTNVAAARVSNPVDNSYFEVYTECVD